MALDAGERRIGVALSDPTQVIARALAIIERRSKAEDFERLRRLVAEYDVERVVVGYPLSLSDEEGPQARRIARWAEALQAALPVPVELWDERYSTVTAAAVLQARGERRRLKRGPLDDVAAAAILQEYLDAKRNQADGDTHTTE
jgi:putative Holliday junction resolvase